MKQEWFNTFIILSNIWIVAATRDSIPWKLTVATIYLVFAVYVWVHP